MTGEGNSSGERDPVGELDLDRELQPVISRLVGERPVPRAAFRGDLRRDLLSGRASERLSPRRARALVTAYGGSGLILLAIAAIGVAGAGPLAA